MNIKVSPVCRAPITDKILELAGMIKLTPPEDEAKIFIPEQLLQARQIRLTQKAIDDKKFAIDAILMPHRGCFIPTIKRATAHELVLEEYAIWEPQFLVVYTGDKYRADKHVLAIHGEIERTKDADLVIVAVVGENRSILATARNVHDGISTDNNTTILELVQGYKDRNVFLIEG